MESEGVSEGRSKVGISKVASKGYEGGAPTNGKGWSHRVGEAVRRASLLLVKRTVII